MESAVKGTILVVDDEPNVIWFITHVTRPQGYETLTATSGHEALAILEELHDKIDLVLLDLRMPGMSGIEALKIIRKKFQSLPVIVLTALDDKREECEAIGVEAFVSKPYSLEELNQKIAFVIGHKSVEKESVTLPSDTVCYGSVLVVDDEPEVCSLIKDFLESYPKDADLKVLVAHSGEEALKVSRETDEPPTVAIVDLRMPHMWGDELIRRWKNGEGQSPKDFIICTAKDDFEERQKAEGAGHHFVPKPSDLEKLTSLVKRICVKNGQVRKKA